jgi:hypothetical protein
MKHVRFGLAIVCLLWPFGTGVQALFSLCRGGQTLPSGNQRSYQGDNWYVLAGKADQLQECVVLDRDNNADPVAAAITLYQQAIQAVDQAQSTDSEERLHQGVFRAAIEKKILVLTRQQAQWARAYREAADLYRRHSLDNSEHVLAEAGPPSCWPSSRDLLAAIHQEKAAQDSELAEADHLLLQAQSSLDTTNPAERDMQRAEQFYQQAVSKYSNAQQINIDDKRALGAINQIDSQYKAISSRGPHDILILSKPLGAKVVWYFRGNDSKTKRIGNCPTTPCKRAFDPWYFDGTGGNFVFSKRLHGAIYVRVMKEGYQAEDKNLTEECRNWSASLPGDYVSDRYCYFTDKVFRVPLIPL